MEDKKLNNEKEMQLLTASLAQAVEAARKKLLTEEQLKHIRAQFLMLHKLYQLPEWLDAQPDTQEIDQLIKTVPGDLKIAQSEYRANTVAYLLKLLFYVLYRGHKAFEEEDVLAGKDAYVMFERIEKAKAYRKLVIMAEDYDIWLAEYKKSADKLESFRKQIAENEAKMQSLIKQYPNMLARIDYVMDPFALKEHEVNYLTMVSDNKEMESQIPDLEAETERLRLKKEAYLEDLDREAEKLIPKPVIKPVTPVSVTDFEAIDDEESDPNWQREKPVTEDELDKVMKPIGGFTAYTPTIDLSVIGDSLSDIVREFEKNLEYMDD